MAWVMLKRSSNFLKEFIGLRSGVVACAYHSKDGVYGCKPLTERQPYQVSPSAIESRANESALYRLVTAYRQHGHRTADLDPLHISPGQIVEELDSRLYGLSPDGSQSHNTEGILYGPAGGSTMSTPEVIKYLQDTYCGPLSVEFEHLPALEEREWLAENYELTQQQTLSDQQKISISSLLLKSQAYDNFLASKFTTVKRYGGEGAESAMAFYDELFKISAQSNISDVILCIAHRGRLNLLTCLLEFPPVVMFRKMKGKSEFPPGVVGLGDVLSHLTSSVDLKYDDKSVHVTMLPNPSHLEAVNPVAMGKTRARQQSLCEGEYTPEGAEGRPGDGALCLMIHGDASFSAQGVVAETFAMSAVPHCNVGGTIHLIINNQIGFTTGKDRGRSTQHCSDLGKMADCPIIHVNGDHPEEVVKACQLAMSYRERFRKDVVVDYVCFRRWGHNEMDEPAFTQPLMYDVIRNRQSIPDMYSEKIVAEGVCDQDDLSAVTQQWTNVLQENYSQIDTHIPKANHLEESWKGLSQPSTYMTSWDTGIDAQILKYVGSQSVNVPQSMKIHSTIEKTHVTRRIEMMEKGTGLDWSAAETLAFGSLMLQGFHVRVCGQDVGRGTFSHRHVMLVDQDTEAVHIPLNNLSDTQTGYIEVCNSILSEEAVLGFEYGMSIESPKLLSIWEAQFGDFFNGAQIMIDSIISGGETKWLLQSSLVMLLPHGLDGAGPEHSSCRVERFLQLTDSSETSVDGDAVNLQVANPTTPAQYFHLLRRQMVRNYRKPLVIVAPKAMLRHPSCVASLSDLAPGTTFKPVIGDAEVNPSQVKRVVVVSGKHYYTLSKERETRGVKDVALVRLESLCPFPAAELQDELNKYKQATDFVWSQEEHRNQGAWSFVAPRFMNIVGRKLRYVGRDVSALPAVGIGEIHQQESKKLITDIFDDNSKTS